MCSQVKDQENTKANLQTRLRNRISLFIGLGVGKFKSVSVALCQLTFGYIDSLTYPLWIAIAYVEWNIPNILKIATAFPSHVAENPQKTWLVVPVCCYVDLGGICDGLKPDG